MESDRVGDICILKPCPTCHHCAVIFECILHFVHEDASDTTENYLLWNRKNYPQISENVLAIDWVKEFNGRSINNCFFFYIAIL